VWGSREEGGSLWDVEDFGSVFGQACEGVNSVSEWQQGKRREGDWCVPYSEGFLEREE
jgi:hypothetical protein